MSWVPHPRLDILSVVRFLTLLFLVAETPGDTDATWQDIGTHTPAYIIYYQDLIPGDLPQSLNPIATQRPQLKHHNWIKFPSC